VITSDKDLSSDFAMMITPGIYSAILRGSPNTLHNAYSVCGRLNVQNIGHYWDQTLCEVQDTKGMLPSMLQSSSGDSPSNNLQAILFGSILKCMHWQRKA
jgi:hypothetical protein